MILRLTTSVIVAGVLTGGMVAADCLHPEDPFQVLDFYIDIDPGDWNTIVNDTTFTNERPAMFSCGNEVPIFVSVRRKPTRVVGAEKVSLKIDINEYLPDQEWHSHRKLSLENGGEGELLREGIAWLLMARAGMIVGTASWVRVYVNGQEIGIYTRVEQIDKAFLRRHLEEDDYFLYKHGERRTREAEADPFAGALCFDPFAQDCPLPPDGYDSLHEILDVPQLLTMAAVNAFIVNPDSLLAKENNEWWYNSPLPRRYFPWDLDTLMKGAQQDTDEDPHDFGKGNSLWQALLLGDPNLLALFDTILARLIQDPFHPTVINRLLDELTPAIGPAIDADSDNNISGGFDGEAGNVRNWVSQRVAFLESILPPSAPFPIVINEVMASNQSIITDEAGEFDDWVELHNRGTSSMSLAGLYLSDRAAFPRRFAFPTGTVIPAGGHLIVWCDNEAFQGPLHAGFRLDADGETIGLYASDAELNRTLDFVWFGPQASDVSIGRFPDGSPGLQTLTEPSPVAGNGGPTPGEVGPTLSVAHGAGPSLVLSWQPSCFAAAPDYAIYEGQIGDWGSHTAVDCSDDLGDLTEEIIPLSGSRYYLVVPHDGSEEGSYGSDSSGVPRSPGTSACAPVHVLNTTTCGVGACQTTVNNCGTVPQTCVPGTPTTEVCNNIDDNCNGVIDDSLGQSACGAGACYVVVPSCIAGEPQTCTPGTPTAEICNNIDDDCNLFVDDGLGQTTCGTGACQVTTDDCIFGVPQTCTPHAPSPEVCDFIDNDCDGTIDGIVAACPGSIPATVKVEHGPGSSLVFNWETSCSAATQDYAIYEGEIGNWYSHTQIDCSDDLGDKTEQIIPAGGSRYYLIVPRGATDEGSYGRDSMNFERPQGVSSCAPAQAIGSCPP